MASQKEGNYEALKPGTYHAVCYSVIDLGTHDTEYKGTKSKKHKIRIRFEIPSERINIDGKDLPSGISKKYTLSLSEKADLYKHLIQWRGKPFTKDELKGFDIFNVVKANCLLQILNDVTKENTTYAFIAGIMPLMKGMSKLAPENPVVTYSLMSNGVNIPETIPDKIKKEIEDSDEIKAMRNAGNNPALAAAQEEYGMGQEHEESNDEVAPF
jgi:hypothetical protein